MKNVYQANDPIEAHWICSLLRSGGLRAVVQGESLWAARGEIPLVPGTAPSVWVAEDDFEQAMQIIAEATEPLNPAQCPRCGWEVAGEPEPRCPRCGHDLHRAEPWICPDCGELIEPQFAVCWRCAGGGQEITGNG